jgi:hypothetical protein
MDDRHAQFLILLEAVFAGAELARLRIELQTIKGTRIGGVPRAASLAGGIDLTSSNQQTVRIGTVEVAFRDVVSFTVAGPEGLGPLGAGASRELG